MNYKNDFAFSVEKDSGMARIAQAAFAFAGALLFTGDTRQEYVRPVL